VQRHQVRESTWAKVEDRVRRIVATIGPIPVGELTVEHVITASRPIDRAGAPDRRRPPSDTAERKTDRSIVKWRRAMVVLASAGGNDVAVIAGLVQTSGSLLAQAPARPSQARASQRANSFLSFRRNAERARR
jgi:hypothetical protein